MDRKIYFMLLVLILSITQTTKPFLRLKPQELKYSLMLPYENFYPICPECKDALECCKDKVYLFKNYEGKVYYMFPHNELCPLCNMLISTCHECNQKVLYEAVRCPKCKLAFGTEKKLFHHLLQSCTKEYDFIEFNHIKVIKLPEDLSTFKSHSEVLNKHIACHVKAQNITKIPKHSFLKISFMVS